MQPIKHALLALGMCSWIFHVHAQSKAPSIEEVAKLAIIQQAIFVAVYAKAPSEIRAPFQSFSNLSSTELLIADVLGRRRTAEAKRALSELTWFYLGEGPSADLDCQIMRQGTQVIPALMNARQKNLCRLHFRDREQSGSGYFPIPIEDKLCLDDEVVQAKISRLIQAIRDHERCE